MDAQRHRQVGRVWGCVAAAMLVAVGCGGPQRGEIRLTPHEQSLAIMRFETDIDRVFPACFEANREPEYNPGASVRLCQQAILDLHMTAVPEGLPPKITELLTDAKRDFLACTDLAIEVGRFNLGQRDFPPYGITATHCGGDVKIERAKAMVR